jgi:two-component system response regulator MprA
MTPMNDAMSGTPAGGPGPGRVMVVDDDAAIRRSLGRALRLRGFTVTEADGGAAALDLLGRTPPDILVLDISMPDVDGIEVCRTLRASGDDLPVLVLSALDEVADRVAGLQAGADDYLVKPFELDELLARVRALLRRSLATTRGGDSLEYAGLRMDTVTREVTRDGRALDLTRTEHALLELFLTHPRQVLTREQILKAVWGFDFEPSSNSLDVYVMYLRRKTGEPRLINTVRGVGYVLRAP